MMIQLQTQVKPKILVVEDAEPLRNDILEMLSFEGFDVRGAENGLSGIDMARNYLPDLIVCDIMMPEKDGYDVLKELQRDLKTRAIPFIFLTAKTDRADRIQGMGMGADDYVTKPFQVAELLDTINARLKRKDDFNEMAEAKVQELSESIITALPHELRTPLNTIMGFSDMLTSEAYNLKPTQIIEWSDHIHQAALRLYRLVENYITYARVETLARNGTKVSNLREQLTDPMPIIEFQVAHRTSNTERASDITTDVQGGVNVRTTEEDLSKIVNELIDNAMKFSEQGTPIKVTGVIEDHQYVLSVVDKGRGMSDEQVAEIGAHRQFERWLHEQQGIGLGLAIVRRLVELYEGTFEVQSRLKEGTTIKISLPIDPS